MFAMFSQQYLWCVWVISIISHHCSAPLATVRGRKLLFCVSVWMLLSQYTIYYTMYFYFVLHEAWCSVISDIFIMICQYMYVIYMDLAKELDSRIWQKYRGKVTPNIRMTANMPFRINSRNQNECKCIYIYGFISPLYAFIQCHVFWV